MIVKELIVDAYGCRAELSDIKAMEKAGRKALGKVGAQIVRKSSYRFQPHGQTLVFILKESHFVVSTWPEFGFATVNIFLCNDAMDAKIVWGEMKKFLRPANAVLKTVSHRIGKARPGLKRVA